MILRRLCEAAPRFDFPPLGYQEGPIKWIVSLDGNGRLLGFTPTTGDSTRKTDRGRRMRFPYVQRTSGVAAQLLADKADYALGLPSSETTQSTESAQGRHMAFRELVQELADTREYEPARAVLRFLDTGTDSLPEEMASVDMVTFEVDGVLLIDDPEVRSFWSDYEAAREQSGQPGMCLVCGRERSIASPHPIPIKRVPGGQSSGCKVVSVNAGAFDSYGHGVQRLTQSPVCWECARNYAQVLNALLESPRHHYTLQDQIAWVFWTREESDFNPNALLFSPEPEEVKALLASVIHGSHQQVSDPSEFYALSLSGSGGRVAIRDWLETTVGRVQENLASYFDDLEIVDNDGQRALPIGLYALLGATIPTTGQNPWKELSPTLAAQLVHATLTGGPFPSSLLQRAVMRARAEQGLTRPRAALIKLYLLRSVYRKGEFPLTPALNTDLRDSGYMCGRLLAVLENVQRSAIPGAKATIIDRYYGAASSAPASVFGTLLRQAQAHLSKLRKTNEGAYFRLQSALEEVAGGLPELPRTLSLAEQGTFALGYYQQRAADRAAAAEARARKNAVTDQHEALEGDKDAQ